MSKQDYDKCLPVKPMRFLSEVAKEAAETLELVRDLPSRVDVINKVESFLKLIKGINRPAILWIVGTWGLGKTAIYNGIIKPYVERNREEYLSVSITANKVFNIVEYVIKKFGLVFMSPEIFLASLIQAMRSEENELRDLPDLSKYANLDQYLVDALTLVKRKLDGRKLVIFIDEFEHIYDRYLQRPENTLESRIGSGILEAIVELVNVNINALRSTNTSSLIHLAISVSEEADAAIRQKTNFMVIAGRLERRFIEIRLNPMYRVEVYYHLSALLRYVFDNDSIDFNSIASPPTLLNIFGYATGGLPGNTEHLLNQILSVLSMTAECPEGLRILDIDTAYTVFNTLETSYKGQKLNVFLRENYIALYREIVNALINAYFDRKASEYFAKTVLMSLGGISCEYIHSFIVNSLGTSVREEDIIDMVTIANNRIRDIYNIEKGIYISKAYHIKSKISDLIIKIKQLIENHLHRFEEALGRIGISFGDINPDVLYREVFDKLIYITSKGELALLIPDDEETLAKYINDKLGAKTELRSLAHLIKSIINALKKEGYLEKDKDDYIVLSEELLQKYIITPSITIVDYIVDLKDRYTYIARARAVGWKPANIAMPLVLPIMYNLKSFFTDRLQDIIQITPKKINGSPDLQVYTIIVRPPSRHKPFLKLLYVVLPEILSEEHIENLRKIVIKEYISPEPLAAMFIILPRNPENFKKSLDYYRYFIEELDMKYQIYVKEFYISSSADVTRLNVLTEYVMDKLGITSLHDFINELISDLTSYILNINKEKIIEKYREKGINIHNLQQYFINDLNMRYFADLKKHLIEGLISIGRYIPVPVLSGESLLSRSSSENNKLINISDIDETIISGLPEVELSHTISSIGYILGYDKCFHEEGCSMLEILDFTKKNITCIVPFGFKIKLLGKDIESSEELLRSIIPLIGYGFINLIKCNRDKNSRGSYDNCRIRINTENPYIKSLVKYVLFLNMYSKRKNIYSSNIFEEYYIYPLEYSEHILRLFKDYFELIGIIMAEKESIMFTFMKNENERPVFVEELFDPLRKTIDSLRQQENEYIGKLCYIVSGKQRGYRAWTYEKLLELVTMLFEPYEKDIINLSRKDLTDMKILLREEVFSKYLYLVSRLMYLYKFLYDAVIGNNIKKDYTKGKISYERPCVLLLVEAANKDIANLENTIDKGIKELDNEIKILENNLNKYVVQNNIKVNLREYNDLIKLREEINKIRNAKYNSLEFLEKVRNLWLKTTNSNEDLNECLYGLKVSGKAKTPTRFPFYFRDQGRKLLFNYKLYQIHELLNNSYKKYIEIMDFNPYEYIVKQRGLHSLINRYRLAEMLENTTDELSIISKIIKIIVENINKLGREKDRFKNKLVEMNEDDISRIKRILGENNYSTVLEILDKSVIESSKIPLGASNTSYNELNRVEDIKGIVIKWIIRQLKALNLSTDIDLRKYENLDETLNKIKEAINNYVNETLEKLKAISELIDKLNNLLKKYSYLKEYIAKYRELLDFMEKIRDVSNTNSSINYNLIGIKVNSIDKRLEQINKLIDEHRNKLIIDNTTILAELISQLYNYINRVARELEKTLNSVEQDFRSINIELINELRRYISSNLDSLESLYDVRKRICSAFSNRSKDIHNVCERVSELIRGLKTLKEDIIVGLEELADKINNHNEFIKLLDKVKDSLVYFSRKIDVLYDLLSREIIETVKKEAGKLGLSDTTIRIMEIIFDMVSKKKDISISNVVAEARARGIDNEAEIYKSIYVLESNGIVMTIVRVK